MLGRWQPSAAARAAAAQRALLPMRAPAPAPAAGAKARLARRQPLLALPLSRYRGSVKKYYTDGPILKGEPTEPLRLGAGLGVASASGDAPFVTLSARKRLALAEGRDAPALTGKARVDFQPGSGKVGGCGPFPGTRSQHAGCCCRPGFFRCRRRLLEGRSRPFMHTLAKAPAYFWSGCRVPHQHSSNCRRPHPPQTPNPAAVAPRAPALDAPPAQLHTAPGPAADRGTGRRLAGSRRQQRRAARCWQRQQASDGAGWGAAAPRGGCGVWAGARRAARAVVTRACVLARVARAGAAAAATDAWRQIRCVRSDSLRSWLLTFQPLSPPAPSPAPAPQQPYLSLRENNWGVHLKRGLWFVTYDL
jgi:hypothetical protein